MTTFTPTVKQAEAIKLIRSMREIHPTGGGVAVISGYAGTGKSSLLRVLAEEEPSTFVLTPTGKAAVRVKEAAGCDAQTLHSWMYQARKDEETGEVKFSQKNSEELRLPPRGTILIDEASMLSQQVWEHLYYYCTALQLNIVLIGDGFQLPPVERDRDKKAFSVFGTDFKADHHIQLTEVFRQALESPILRIVTIIRSQNDISTALTQLETVSEKRLEEVLAEVSSNRGFVICHRNITRHFYNSKIRELRKLPGDKLVEEEPLIVTRNNYPVGVFNGEVFTLGELQEPRGPVPVVDRYKNKSLFMKFQEVRFSDGPQQSVIISPEEVFGKSDIDADAIRRKSRSLMRNPYGDPDSTPNHVHMNLGYVISCHRAQGSQQSEGVVIVEESVRLNTLEGRRWLYTALSRFKDRVRVCWM